MRQKARPRKFTVALASQDCDRLYLACRARGGELPKELLYRLVHTVLRDDLVEAVLDDERKWSTIEDDQRDLRK